MPYVSESRSTGSVATSWKYLTGPSTGLGSSMDACTHHQATYSFRTGRKSWDEEGIDLVKLDPQSETYKPSGDIVSQLRYRKSFIERQMALVSSRPGAPSNFLLGDIGHEFATAKVSFVGGTNNVTRFNSASGYYSSFDNVRPSSIRAHTSDGAIASVGMMMDPFGGYFAQKGFRFSTYGSSFGATMSSLRAASSNHISVMNPFASKASVLSTLLELARGDIPNLMRSLRKHLDTIASLKASGVKSAAKAVGSEYLNNVFGWSPIIRDIDKSMKVLITLDSLLFPEDSTRRTVQRVLYTRGSLQKEQVTLIAAPPLGDGTFTNSASDKWTVNGSSTSALPYAATAGFADVQYSISDELSLWTSARFATSMRPSMTNNRHLDAAIDLLGLKLTPEVIWEITPWSWLIDWFSNMGTVIGNLSTLGLSNTILNYAYSTARWKTVCSADASPVITTNSTGITAASGSFKYSWTGDYKVRYGASPFGFDVSLSALSSAQWAILAALGLARSR